MPQFNSSHTGLSHNPFLVPEGYLAGFTERMMQRIPPVSAAPTRTMRFVRSIPWLAAACIAALMLLFTQVPSLRGADSTPATAQSEAAAQTNADVAYDYLMLADADNYTLYGTDY